MHQSKLLHATHIVTLISKLTTTFFLLIKCSPFSTGKREKFSDTTLSKSGKVWFAVSRKRFAKVDSAHSTSLQKMPVTVSELQKALATS